MCDTPTAVWLCVAVRQSFNIYLIVFVFHFYKFKFAVIYPNQLSLIVGIVLEASNTSARGNIQRSSHLPCPWDHHLGKSLVGWGGEEANLVLPQAVPFLQWEVEAEVEQVQGGAGSSTHLLPPPGQPSNKVLLPRHLHRGILSYSPGERVLQKIDGIHARLLQLPGLHLVKVVERIPPLCTRTARGGLKVFLAA
jgi:hypothetical protein